MPGRRALVTGATGFVGGNLSRRLVEDGWSVSAVVRPSSDTRSLIDQPGIELHTHDGTTSGMVSILRAAHPDVVFHLAAATKGRHQPEDVEALIQSNILFSTQVAEAAVLQGVHAFINTGSHWQHYRNQESNPVSLYAACKQGFEDILRYYSDAAGLRVLTLILFDTYGANDGRPKLFTLLKQAAQTGQTLSMTPGDQLVDLVHIDDVVNAYCVAAHICDQMPAATQKTYTVQSGEPISVREAVRTFMEVTRLEVPIHWGAKEYRAREVMLPWNRGTPLPGWSPRVSLKEGLKSFLS
jgi:nucleoside-diphosphate-sugar epimerase